jgi:hypothetical protein
VKRIKTFRTARQTQQAAKAEREYDLRRARESETRRLYWTARWRGIARQQLNEQPLCVKCEADGFVTAATVCDHVIPHRGDVDLFWNGERQSLCGPCHSSTKQTEEASTRRR